MYSGRGWSTSVRSAPILLALLSLAVPARAQRTSVAVEPYVGLLRWDEAAAREERILAGVLAGLRLPYGLGLYGFYSESVDEEPAGAGLLRNHGVELEAQILPRARVAPFWSRGSGDWTRR